MSIATLPETAGSEPLVSEQHSELFHYTSISSLEGILATEILWATQATHLNDSSELKQLWPRILPLVTSCFKSEMERFVKDKPDLLKEISDLGGVSHLAKCDGEMFVKQMQSQLFAMGPPFVVSFTTHSANSDNTETDQSSYHREHGRLSQWRAYGGGDGVALVFDSKRLEEMLVQEAERFEYWWCSLSDVVYDNEEVTSKTPLAKFMVTVEEVSRGFFGMDESIALRSMQKFTSMLPGVVGRVKHAGFDEERECRIMAWRVPQSSHWITSEDLRREFEQERKSSANAEKKIHYRAGKDGGVPYIKLFECSRAELPIVRVIVGPSRSSSANLEKVRDLVGSRNIDVHLSTTPYVGSV